MPLRRSSRKRTPTKPLAVGLDDTPRKNGTARGNKGTSKVKCKKEEEPDLPESPEKGVRVKEESYDCFEKNSDDESLREKAERSDGDADADADDAEDSGSSDDDKEEDEEYTKTKPPRRKRGRPSGAATKKRSRSRSRSAKSPREQRRDYGPEEERTCPFCGKVFSIVTGLAYHIEHRVCQKPKKPLTTSAAIGTVPYPVLKPGEKFVTTFGVVKVLGDKRIPDDYGKTRITKEIKKKKTVYNKRRDRLVVRRGKLNLYMMKVSRKRRAALLQLYNDRYGQGQENRNVQVDAETYAKKIFQLYCPSSTAKELLTDGDDTKIKILVQKPLQPIPDLGPNPAFPADCYPGRIVECVLVKDERKRVTDMEEVVDGRWSHVDSAIALVEKVQQKSRQKNANGNGDGDGDGRDDNSDEVEHGMKVFIRREDLIQRYNAESPVYICTLCGKDFYSRVGCKNHLDENICTRQRKEFEEERQSRLEEVEASLDAVVRPPPSLLPPAPPLPPGQKKRKNAHKLPGWIVFHPHKSVMYPEVFIGLKFKRGSNNTKFMHKKWVDMGPGRKKHRKSRAQKTNQAITVINQVDNFMDCSNLPMYPAVFAALFSTTVGERKPSSRTASLRAKQKVAVQIGEIGDDSGHVKMEEEYNPEDDQADFHPDDMDIDSPMPPLPMPAMPALPVANEQPPLVSPLSPLPKAYGSGVATNKKVDGSGSANATADTGKQEKAADKSQEQTPPPKKRRRRKRSSSPAPAKPIYPIIVDIRPLVEEINAGRYPSMKAYNGEHLDICFHCKTRDKNVLHCEFCANSEHLSCLQSKVKIRDLEPEDAFMCHRCVQTVMARRARAEKRRLSKLNDALRATGGNNVDNVNSEVGNPNSLTSPIEQAKIAASRKREITWSQSEFDAHVATYSKCPTGGPGGLICCRPCTASYSNLLNDTAREMESQTVSTVGREVSELIELLHDAQIRLRQAVDVSNGNDVRRNILNPNDAKFNDDESRANRNGKSLMGIIDIFSK